MWLWVMELLPDCGIGASWAGRRRKPWRALQGTGAKAPLTKARTPDVGLSSAHNQADLETLPERCPGQRCHQPLGQGKIRPLGIPTLEKIRNRKFKIGTNSKTREKRFKRILIFVVMNFFRVLFCFVVFCEMLNTNLSFPTKRSLVPSHLPASLLVLGCPWLSRVNPGPISLQ